jgi:hypothetical protein
MEIIYLPGQPYHIGIGCLPPQIYPGSQKVYVSLAHPKQRYKWVDKKDYEAQKCNLNKGDWVQIMLDEREKYGILESDETITKMSQEKYRNHVKKKVYSHAVAYLHALASPHSE